MEYILKGTKFGSGKDYVYSVTLIQRPKITYRISGIVKLLENTPSKFYSQLGYISSDPPRSLVLNFQFEWQ